MGGVRPRRRSDRHGVLSMTLEEQLLAAANAGLTHLSLHPVFSEDRKTTYWRATATPSTMHKYVSTQSLSPVEAVSEVLKALPKAPARTKPVTAAVSDHPCDLDLPVVPNILVDKAGNDIYDPPNPNGELDQWLPKA